MLALTKRRRTEMVEVTVGRERGQKFIGPREKVKPLLRLLSDRGFTLVNTKEAIPWRQVFASEIEKYGEPGMVLKGLRGREGLTQAQLARKLGIAHYNLSKMENGSRPISKKMAVKLAKILKTDYRVFL